MFVSFKDKSNINTDEICTMSVVKSTPFDDDNYNVKILTGDGNITIPFLGSKIKCEKYVSDFLSVASIIAVESPLQEVLSIPQVTVRLYEAEPVLVDFNGLKIDVTKSRDVRRSTSFGVAGGYVLGLVPNVSAETAEIEAMGDLTPFKVKIEASSEPIENIFPLVRFIPFSKSMTSQVQDANGIMQNPKDYVWSSTDISVATVSQLGVVTTVSKGKTMILATIPSNGNKALGQYLVVSKNSNGYEYLENNLIGSVGRVYKMQLLVNGQVQNKNSDVYSSDNYKVCRYTDEWALMTGIGESSLAVEVDTSRAYTVVKSKNIGELIRFSELEKVSHPGQDNYYAGVLGADGELITSSKIKYTSSNTSVATIGSDGYVKVVSEGECMIVANYEGINYGQFLTSAIDSMILEPISLKKNQASKINLVINGQEIDSRYFIASLKEGDATGLYISRGYVTCSKLGTYKISVKIGAKEVEQTVNVTQSLVDSFESNLKTTKVGNFDNLFFIQGSIKTNLTKGIGTTKVFSTVNKTCEVTETEDGTFSYKSKRYGESIIMAEVKGILYGMFCVVRN